jgi:UDP-N-acetylglucosamine--N-acetylmuramyl-(pentapeptide) pyrophosphoryl-undecaprenol N-acetylglucosamine transferase
VAPGLANKIMARLSMEIFTAFPAKNIKNLPPKKILAVGNPIRSGLMEGSKDNAQKLFNLTGQKPVLLFLGGSQGAQKINDMLLIILSEILDNFEIIHQTGIKNFDQIKKESEIIIPEDKKKFYHPAAFMGEEELADAFSACDIVISRAGAGSIFEIAAKGKPSILIPLAGSAQNHQVSNAYAYAENGACQVIEEPNLTPLFFVERVKLLFSRPEEMAKMAQKAKEFSKIKAAEVIANYLMEYMKK